MAVVVATSDLCRHCGKAGIRRRNLCRSCYYTPDIRARYPSTAPRGRRMGPDTFDDPSAWPMPTEHAPGSWGKIEELRRRLECHEQLWSRTDEPLDRETAGSQWMARVEHPGEAREWVKDPSGQLWFIEEVPAWWARAGRQLGRFLRDLFRVALGVIHRRRHRRRLPAERLLFA